MNIIKSLVLCVSSLLIITTANGESIALRENVDDLRIQRLAAAPDAPLANRHRERVQYTAPVNRRQSLPTSEGFVAVSREYRTNVSADQLRKGVVLHTTGPGAVVSLSPSEVVKGSGLSPLDLSIRTPDGRVLRGSDGMDQLVNRQAIQATGVPFSNGMVGFRLNRALGSGKFTLTANRGVASASYQLHVFDAQGSAELSLHAPEQALVGQSFEATGRFSSSRATRLTAASAFLLNPDGERIDAKVHVNGDQYSVVTQATMVSSFQTGLWELHVSVSDVAGVQRDVKTAFASAYPTARFDGTIEHNGMHFDVGIEVASAGRYEASAILYGTAANELVPVAMSATAQWLEPGAGTILLTFNADQVKAAGVTAPFALSAVTLKDQSRMSVLERIKDSAAF